MSLTFTICHLNILDAHMQIDKGKRVVEDVEGRLWADAHGFHYFETSAQSGDGITEMFNVRVCVLIHRFIFALILSSSYCRLRTRALSPLSLAPAPT